MRLITLSLFLVFLFDQNCFGTAYTIPQNQVLEWGYTAQKQYQNPFSEVRLYADITGPNGTKMKLPAYWAGENEWRFRFSSPEQGTYRYTTQCSNKSDKQLHGNSGTIIVKAYKGKNSLYIHGLVKVSDQGNYLEHADGKPFLWLADSWWHGMTTRFTWPEDFKLLTADRKSKGFSVIQFAIGFPCDIEPFDIRGQNEAGDPWDPEMISINPAYFDLVDLRIEWLIREGLVPNIVGAWGYYMKWMGVERMKKHWEYLMARYGAYPVTWTLCGESTLAWYHDLADRWEEERARFREQWSDVAEHIQKNDAFDHLLTVHPGPGIFDGKPPIDKMEYIDMVMVQSGHDGFATLPKAKSFMKRFYAEYPDKPVIHGEVCFEGMKGSSRDDVQRFLFWTDVLTGAPGFSYGVEGIWQFNTEKQLFGVSPGGNTWGNVPWETAYQYLGSIQVGLGKQFLENYEWWKLSPDRTRIESNINDEVYAPYCASIEDHTYLLYFHKPPTRWRSYKLNGLDRGAKYRVQFFDPIEGDVYAAGEVLPDSDAKIAITETPIMQDWVVIIEKTNK